MKKRSLKIVLGMLVLIVVLMLQASVRVEATVTLDSRYIDMPSQINKGEGTIHLSSEVTGGYSLYYQYIMTTKAVADNIKTKVDEIEKYQEKQEKDLKEEQAKLAQLEKDTQAIVDDATKTDEEKQEAINKYSTAAEKFNTNVENYKTTLQQKSDAITGSIPSYNDSKWVQTNDGKIKVDLSQYSGQVYMVLWAKLVYGGKTYYNTNIYSTEVEQEITITLDKKEASVEMGKTLNLKATTNKEATITWSSNNTSVATVNANGVVTPVKEGVATITATINGTSANCTVTVTKASATPDVVEGDFSKVTYTATTTGYDKLSIELKNFKPVQNAIYEIYISKNKNEKPVMGDNTVAVGLHNGKYMAYYSGQKAQKILEEAGTNYIYLIQRKEGKEEVVASNIEMKYPTLPEVGKRMDLFLQDNTITAFANKIAMTTSRTVTYKIGKVSSNDVLKAFKNESESVAFNKLLQYAKSAQYVKTGTMKAEDLNYNIAANLQLDQNAYYFVYLVADDENGKYHELEDVGIYRPNGAKSPLVHFAYSSIKIGDEVLPSVLPQTGLSYTIIITMITITAIGVIAFMRYRSYRDVK